MKYLIALIFLGALFACGGNAGTKNTSANATNHLVSYVNNVVNNSPGWDNNAVTKTNMLDKLAKGFAKDMQDSDLLAGYVFQLEKVENSFGNVYTVSFKPLELTEISLVSEIPVKFEIHAAVPDSLAKSLKESEIYTFTKYSKNPSDTNYSPSMSPMGFSIDNDYSHKITKCDLGSHSVHIEQIKVFDPTKR